jgi:adenylate cyclase
MQGWPQVQVIKKTQSKGCLRQEWHKPITIPFPISSSLPLQLPSHNPNCNLFHQIPSVWGCSNQSVSEFFLGFDLIALDRNYARAYSGLAISYAAEVWLGTSKSPRESLVTAIELAEKAVSLDELDATAQVALAYLYGMTRQYEKAIAQAQRALRLDPNSYSVVSTCGLVLAYLGRNDEALPLLEKAARLNPSISHSFVSLSMAYRMAGQYDKAYGEAKKAVERDPQNQLAQVSLITSSILTGREDEARVAAVEVLKINPNFSVEQYGRNLPYKDARQIAQVIGALRKAGLR